MYETDISSGKQEHGEASSILIQKLVLQAFSWDNSFDPGNTGTGEGGNSGTIWHRGWPGFVRLSIILVADGKAYHGRKTKGVELALFFCHVSKRITNQ